MMPAVSAAEDCVYLSVSFDGQYIDDKNGDPIVYLPVPMAAIESVDLTEYGLDNMLYEDARKEFSLTMMTSFGADGDENQRKQDFAQVRGAKFESDSFVLSVKEHIRAKSELYFKVINRINELIDK